MGVKRGRSIERIILKCMFNKQEIFRFPVSCKDVEGSRWASVDPTGAVLRSESQGRVDFGPTSIIGHSAGRATSGQVSI